MLNREKVIVSYIQLITKCLIVLYTKLVDVTEIKLVDDCKFLYLLTECETPHNAFLLVHIWRKNIYGKFDLSTSIIHINFDEKFIILLVFPNLMSRLVCRPFNRNCHSVGVCLLLFVPKYKNKYPHMYVFIWLHLCNSWNQKQKLFEMNEFTRNLFPEK